MLNANIILAGRQPDFVNTLNRSNIAAAGFNRLRDDNALRQLYQTQGAGIATGNRNALNALAQLNPMAALDVQNTRDVISNRNQRTAILNAEEQRRVAEYARGLKDDERAQEAARIKQGVSMGLGATSPEQWDAMMTQFNLPDMVGQFENRRMHAHRFMEMADILESMEPIDPTKGAPSGYRWKDPTNRGAGVTQLDGMLNGNDQRSRKIAEYQQTYGVDEGTAMALADGLIKPVTDPISRETTLVDLRTGRPWGGISQPQGQPPQAAPEAPVAQPTQPYTFGNTIPGMDDAFGAEGAVKRGVNTVAGAFGKTVYPDVQEAQADISVMREALTNDIASGYDGRVPAFLLKNIQDLTPEGGKVLEGPGAAQSKLNALRRSLEGELSVAEKTARRKMSPKGREALETRMTALSTAIARIDRALGSFSDGISNTTSSGITWSVK